MNADAGRKNDENNVKKYASDVHMHARWSVKGICARHFLDTRVLIYDHERMHMHTYILTLT